VLHRLSVFLLVAFALIFASDASAQSLTLPLLERYLEALRIQAGIPGISAGVIQGGAVIWERGLGRADIELRTPASPDTPYAIGNLTEALTSSLLLRKCVDQSYMTTLDPVRNWVAGYSDSDTLVGHLLAHAAPGGGFKYDPARFAQLTPALEQCTNRPYRVEVQSDLFDLLAMKSSVAGFEFLAPPSQNDEAFPPAELARLADVLHRAAVPYRVVNGRATRSDVPASPMSMQTGVVTTLRDLERFDLALRSGFLLRPQTRQRAWTNVVAGDTVLPTGLGWFVQNYNGEAIVWQFGLVKDAWSSLILKVPGRDLTVILLANSDGLSAPFLLENGDVTTSPFARIFLKLLAP
jgi:CubicO group peptidase (beta-lactamase class C family)